MTIWRKSSVDDTGPHVVGGWVNLKSIWRKSSDQDAYNSSLSPNPWVIGGWTRIKTIWRKASDSDVGSHVINGWVKIWGDISGYPVATTSPTLLANNIENDFKAGSTITLTRGVWSNSPTSYSLKIQSSLDESTWSDVATGTGSSISYDITYDNAKSPSRYFRGVVSATNSDGTGYFYTTATISIIKLSVSANVFNESQHGATFSWVVTPSTSAYIDSARIDIYTTSNSSSPYYSYPNAITPQIVSDNSISTSTTYNGYVVVISNDTSQTENTSSQLQFTTLSDLMNTVAPTISGTVKEGQIISASSGTWSGVEPISYSYQWQYGVSFGPGLYSYYDIAGATSSTYTIPYNYNESYPSKVIRVKVTATNSVVPSGVIAYSGTESVQDTLPPVGTAGTVTFSRDSQTSYNYSITSVGTWTNSPTSYRYQWYTRTVVGPTIIYTAISGATGSTFDASNYKLQDILVYVWGTNAAGESTDSITGNYQKVYYKAPVINSFSVTGGTQSATYYYSYTTDDPSATAIISYSGASTGSFTPSTSGSTRTGLLAGNYYFALTVTNTSTSGNSYATSSYTGLITVSNPVCTASCGSYSYGPYGSCYSLFGTYVKQRTGTRTCTATDCSTYTESITETTACVQTLGQCTNFDVTNSSSTNYAYCYSVGQCAAPYGTRVKCGPWS